MGLSYLYDVFLSSASEDVPLLHYMRDVMQRNDLRVATFDTLQTHEETRNVIDRAASIVFLLTPAARQSQRVLSTVRYARTSYIGSAIPVLAGGDARTSVPYGLMSWLSIDLRGDHQAALHQLIDRIHIIAASVRGAEARDRYLLPQNKPPAAADVQPQPTPVITHDIFLSYRATDSQAMHTLCDTLRSAGFSVWLDEMLTDQDDWRSEIERAILGTRAVVTLLSANVVSSSWVVEDIAFAQAHSKLLFPVTLDDSPLRIDAPYALRDVSLIRWDADLTPDERAAALQSLVDSLRAYLDD